MATQAALTSFFGWFTIVLMAFYLLTVIGIFLFRGLMTGMSTKLFGISEEQVLVYAYQYVGSFKLAILLLAFAPWVTLKLMG